MRRPDVVSKFEIFTSGLRMRPGFLVIGAQKAGTSSIHSYLIRHPNVLPPKRKEVRYFGSNYNEKKGLSWYLAHFPLMRPSTKTAYITGESTPDYMFQQGAIASISKVLPDVKLIVMLRDPAERVISHYNMVCRKRDREFPSLEEITDLYLQEKEIPEDILKIGFIERGYYFRQIERILKYFPKDQLNITILEDLDENPGRETNKIYKFLGLQSYTLENYRRVNQASRGHSQGKKLKANLAAHYKPFNQKLYDFLGRNLNWEK